MSGVEEQLSGDDRMDLEDRYDEIMREHAAKRQRGNSPQTTAPPTDENVKKHRSAFNKKSVDEVKVCVQTLAIGYGISFVTPERVMTAITQKHKLENGNINPYKDCDILLPRHPLDTYIHDTPCFYLLEPG